MKKEIDQKWYFSAETGLRKDGIQRGRGTGSGEGHHPDMAARNSALLRVLLILSRSSSMVSTLESGLSTLRSTQTRFSSSLVSSSSSLRVPLLLTSIAGK